MPCPLHTLDSPRSCRTDNSPALLHHILDAREQRQRKSNPKFVEALLPFCLPDGRTDLLKILPDSLLAFVKKILLWLLQIVSFD